MHLYRSIKPYILIVLSFAIVYMISNRFSGNITEYITHTSEGEKLLLFLTGVLVFSLGFFVYYLAKATPIPSFVLVIFFGFAATNLLSPLLNDALVTNSLVTLGAIFILFGGGLETPFKNFKQLFSYIASLAFVGTFITAFTLSLTLFWVSRAIGFDLTIPAIVVLGAALSSTDPAAIIPCFDKLVFRKNRVKHIAVSESALNDVVGAILTLVFLTAFQSAEKVYTSVGSAYGALLHSETLLLFAEHVIIGLIVGWAGYMILEFWNRFKKKINAEEETDNAFFLVIPLIVYTVSQVFGGSGFLAAFLSALLFSTSEHIRHVEHYFNHTVKGFMKPMIFIILGAMVDLESLIAFAPIGIITAIIFMFVLRPMVVFITLGVFSISKERRLDLNELLFLSFVRETGVIPAVLLVTLAGSGIPGAEAILPIGMWVILFTLLIEPPLTPVCARLLKIADPIETGVSVQIGGGTEPSAVLVTRGNSFGRRLPYVIDWATTHNITNIAILHSPEQDHNPDAVAEKTKQANELFKEINSDRKNGGLEEIEFEFITEPGYLQDNIKRYIQNHSNISIIFAGKKMLDFRSNDIKNLPVPFLFID